MRNYLPPLNSLLVFLTASRVLNFTRAAEELHLTRSAVSRQIKNLEDYFEVKLFERHPVGLELTNAGVQYANALSLIFADLKSSTNSVFEQQDDLKIRLGISATFNSTWLMSRLSHLDSIHPQLALAFVTNNYDTGHDSVDFISGTMDAAIRLGNGDWQGCQVDKLIDIYVQPVCSPLLLSSPTDTLDIKELVNYNWLHYKHLPDLWPQWLAKLGHSGMTTNKRNIEFDNVAVATQAAVDGLGIIPMYRPLADPLLDEQKLILAHDFIMKKEQSYYFVCPDNYQQNNATQFFRDWIIEESNRSQQNWLKKVGLV